MLGRVESVFGGFGRKFGGRGVGSNGVVSVFFEVRGSGVEGRFWIGSVVVMGVTWIVVVV